MSDIHVNEQVKVIPAKWMARFDVPLDGMQALSRHKLAASVNAKSITFGRTDGIPKTLEAANAIVALAEAVRDELIEQGITE